MFDKVPRWFLICSATVGILAVGAIGTWAGAEIRLSTKANADQDSRIHVLEFVADENRKRFDRIDDKLDKIIERMGM